MFNADARGGVEYTPDGSSDLSCQLLIATSIYRVIWNLAGRGGRRPPYKHPTASRRRYAWHLAFVPACAHGAGDRD